MNTPSTLTQPTAAPVHAPQDKAQSTTAQDFEDLLDFARILRGLEATSVSAKPEHAELTLHVSHDTGACWIAFLSCGGFRFDAGCSYQHPSGGNAIEARRAAYPLIERPAQRVVIVIANQDRSPQ